MAPDWVPDHLDMYQVHIWLAEQAGADVVLDHVHSGAAHRGVGDLELGCSGAGVVVDRDDQAHIHQRHRDFGILHFAEGCPESIRGVNFGLVAPHLGR